MHDKSQKDVNVDYSQEKAFHPDWKTYEEQRQQNLKNMVSKNPNVAAALKGKHVDGCSCEYCEPMASQKDAVEQMKEEDAKIDEIAKVSGHACIDGRIDKAKPILHKNVGIGYAFTTNTHKKEQEMLKKIKREDAKLPEMDHTVFPKSDIDSVRRACDIWQDICDKEDEEVEDVRVQEEAEILAQELLKERAIQPLKGIMVVYINVGQLPKKDAETQVEEYKKKWENILNRVPEAWDTICVPVREGQTRIEMMRF